MTIVLHGDFFWSTAIIVGMIALYLAIPAKWDPLIKWKEHQSGWHDKPETIDERKPDELKCTYCGGTEFYEGPSGGMSTNVICANRECRHRFNWTPMISRLEDLNMVEPIERFPDAA